MSLLGLAQTVADTLLTIEQIRTLYHKSIEAGFMRADCTVKRLGAYGAIPELAVNLLGMNRVYIKQVGGLWYGSGKVRWWGPKTVNHTIVKGKTVAGNSHYREADDIGNIVYDPRPTVRIVEELVELFYLVEVK